MTFRRSLPRFAVLAACAMLATACSKSTSDTESSTSASSQPTTQADRHLTVGFAQVGAESGWRTANTESIKSEAEKRGIDLKFSDAQQKQENQIRAIRSFIDQHVDVIAFSPVVKTGWEPVLLQAKRAHIPVILSDRGIDADPDLYATFIGSDFVEEGRRAGRWLAKATDGHARIAELQGTTGADPANDRQKGFMEAIKDYPDMKVIKSQTGDFTRTGGKQVMEAFLKSPEGKQITAVFAHNDDMALGAIQAIEEAGLKPGKDIKIVSIDGVKGAFEAMLAGKLNCTVECNPLLGPQIYDTAEKLAKGQEVPKRITSDESVYDQSKVTPELVASRKY
jgi:simple sugar transport system substrate-binding protein